MNLALRLIHPSSIHFYIFRKYGERRLSFLKKIKAMSIFSLPPVKHFNLILK